MIIEHEEATGNDAQYYFMINIMASDYPLVCFLLIFQQYCCFHLNIKYAKEEVCGSNENIYEASYNKSTTWSN